MQTMKKPSLDLAEVLSCVFAFKVEHQKSLSKEDLLVLDTLVYLEGGSPSAVQAETGLSEVFVCRGLLKLVDKGIIEKPAGQGETAYIIVV